MDLDVDTVPNLTGQVIIRDFRALRGGYANVYPGEWRGKAVKILVEPFLWRS
jgi:hypothetical protein